MNEPRNSLALESQGSIESSIKSIRAMKYVTETEKQRSIITEEADDLKDIKDRLDVKVDSSKAPRTLKSPRASQYLKNNIMKRYEPKKSPFKDKKRSKTTH